MKILYILQQSIVNKTDTPRWSTADSNVQMFAGLLNQIDQHTEWDVTAVVGGPFVDEDAWCDIFMKSRAKWMKMPIPVDPVLARYTFHTDFWRATLAAEQPDVIINCVAELTRNFRALLWSMDLRVPVIQCCYWLDLPHIYEGKIAEELSYELRQLDGALAADAVVFTCQSAKEGFFDNLKELGGFNGEYIEKKSTIWDFGFSAEEIEQGEQDISFDKCTFLFPNRLSDNGYTHFQTFIDAANILWQRRKDFQVVFTNPSQRIPWSELKQRVKPLYIVKESQLTRTEYVATLWKTHVVVSLFLTERYGGCANVEAMYAQNLPIMPKVHEYARRAPNDYPLFVPMRAGAAMNPWDLANTMAYAIDHYDDIVQKHGDAMREHVYHQSSFESVFERVKSDVEKVVNNDGLPRIAI